MRIIQISDLHFGMNQTQIIEPFLNDISFLQPEVIIISGDLTQRATEEQYGLLRDFLKKLPGTLLIVPGNHDIPFYNVISRWVHPFKHYKHYISPQLECEFSNNEVNILGVSSVNPYAVKDGLLTEETITRIKTHFSADSGQLNILFFHHNLNYFSGMHHPLNNADELLTYIKDSPIHMVCTGHLHYANIKLIPKQKGQFALLHAGSLLCERTKDGINSYYLIETNHLKYSVEWRVFGNDSFESQQIQELDFTTS